MSALDFFHDPVVRTEIYDAFQAVLGNYRLLKHPPSPAFHSTIRPMATARVPGPHQWRSIDTLIGWCLTYPVIT
jgi:amidase/aspartyl-tRNA(Asn)/glutamyl-tRNA(Gln) amidotransferase subunit A